MDNWPTVLGRPTPVGTAGLARRWVYIQKIGYSEPGVSLRRLYTVTGGELRSARNATEWREGYQTRPCGAFCQSRWHKEKGLEEFLQGLCINPGNDLLSHQVSLTVPLALRGLTSVFGMGTGVTPALLPPGKSRDWNSQVRSRNRTNKARLTNN